VLDDSLNVLLRPAKSSRDGDRKASNRHENESDKESRANHDEVSLLGVRV